MDVGNENFWSLEKFELGTQCPSHPKEDIVNEVWALLHSYFRVRFELPSSNNFRNINDVPRNPIRGHPRGSKVVPLDSTDMISYLSLIVPDAVSCTVCEIALEVHNPRILLPLLRLTPPTEGFPWDELRKILQGGQRMANVHSDEEILPKASTSWV